MIPVDRPAWLTEAAWPWRIQQLDTPAGRIAVTDAGAGPTLLLSHVGMWSFVWRDLMRHLEDGYRLVTFDAPGTGLSQRTPPSIRAAAQAIGRLVDDLDLTDLTLVAHDVGGVAALRALADRPERVASVVAVNTFGWRPAGPVFRGALAVMGSAPVRELDAWSNALPAATSSGLGAGRGWSPVERRIFRRAFDRPARRAVHHYLGDARRDDASLARVEQALQGPLADRPLITVFGERNDPLGLQPGWKARFPDAVQHVVPRGNHFPMTDAPEQVSGWIRSFLASSRT